MPKGKRKMALAVTETVTETVAETDTEMEMDTSALPSIGTCTCPHCGTVFQISAPLPDRYTVFCPEHQIISKG